MRTSQHLQQVLPEPVDHGAGSLWTRAMLYIDGTLTRMESNCFASMKFNTINLSIFLKELYLFAR